MSRPYRALVALLLLFMLFGSAAGSAREHNESPPIIMQLRWLHQFQFAGYYAALHKGFYRERGLTVILRAGAPDRNPISEVLAGRATYGTANSELLYHYLQGEPLVALAAIFQHSPSILLARLESGIRTPQDLIGKRVMMIGGTDDVDFLAMLANEGVHTDQIHILPSSYDIRDLIEKRTDLFNAYLTNEPFFLQEQGVASYALKPINYGVDFYSDILFTTQEEIRRHPQRVAAFREATLRGWEYAMAHPDEIIDLLLQEYPIEKSRAHLQYEAEMMQSLILPNLIPMGNINPGRFERMAQLMAQFKLTPAQFSLKEFIYDPHPVIDLRLFWWVTLSVLLLLAMTLAVALMLWRLNYRLKSEIRIRRAAESSLIESEHHFRGIIENLQDVYYRADLNGRVLFISPAVEQIFGYTVEESLGQDLADYYLPPFSREAFLRDLSQAGGLLHGYQIKVRSKEGRERWVRVNSRFITEEERVVGVEGTIHDMTDLKSYQDQCLLMALRDPLTNLPNRRNLLDLIDLALATNRRHLQIGALLFIDLDRFKPINDRYGHAMGDELLKEAARRLQNQLREEDSVARIGGDEFVVLLPRLNPPPEAAKSESEQVARRIRTALESPFLIQEQTLQISASIGIALFPEDVVDGDELIQRADAAMYQAKRTGRNRISF